VEGTLTRPALVGLRCRTSDRTAGAVRGVEALASELGDRLGIEPRLIGRPGEPREQDWEGDLQGGRGCLLEAGGQVDDALAARGFPILVAGDCAVALTTLPTVHRHRPDALVLWLDAHGDFNTPDTTPSRYLSGMALAGACGCWDPGLIEESLPGAQVVLCGVRDLDNDERGLLDGQGITVIGASLETLVYVVNALDGRPVYVHLDLDVLDPEVFPAQYPAAGGLSDDKLFDLLEAAADACEIVGMEIAGFEAPADANERVALANVAADAVEPLFSHLIA